MWPKGGEMVSKKNLSAFSGKITTQQNGSVNVDVSDVTVTRDFNFLLSCWLFLFHFICMRFCTQAPNRSNKEHQKFQNTWIGIRGLRCTVSRKFHGDIVNYSAWDSQSYLCPPRQRACFQYYRLDNGRGTLFDVSAHGQFFDCSKWNAAILILKAVYNKRLWLRK